MIQSFCIGYNLAILDKGIVTHFTVLEWGTDSKNGVAIICLHSGECTF